MLGSRRRKMLLLDTEKDLWQEKGSALWMHRRYPFP
ncbi:MAG: hypothetical protein JWM59_2799 [Verrucomicrobiales bacterium]|nr:hypothetical protein [Verrucomicrobiales bacterium]